MRHFRPFVRLTGLVLVKTYLESVVVDDAVDVCGEMVEDLKRQVTKRLLGALDPLARVGLGECDTQELSSGLQLAVIVCLGNVDFGSLCESVQILDTLLEVGVVNTRLKSESVLDSTCVGVEKVQSSSAHAKSAGVNCRIALDIQLFKKVFLAQLALALIGVNPNSTRQVLANELQLTPVLPALHVSLIRRACAEGDSETDDETQDSKQQIAYVQGRNEFRYAGNSGRPHRDSQERNDHLWQY